jgi:hypothetical protein
MAYELFDVNGMVSHGPSIKGWDELRLALNKIVDANSYPQTNMLFRLGYATGPLALKVELGILQKKLKDPIQQSTVQTLIDAATRSKEIVILRH